MDLHSVVLVFRNTVLHFEKENHGTIFFITIDE